jgi:hypothetical protein
VLLHAPSLASRFCVVMEESNYRIPPTWFVRSWFFCRTSTIPSSRGIVVRLSHLLVFALLCVGF